MATFIIIFDTCIIRSDHKPDSALWTEFKELRRHNPVTVSIPDIVFKEFNSFKAEPENKMVTTYNEAIKTLANESTELKDLGLLDTGMVTAVETALQSLKSVLAVANQPARELRTRQIFTALFGNVTYIPFPNVTHEILVDRCQAHKKPFSSDKGYKDALIWYSIMNHLSANPSAVLVFVSSNTDDFSDHTKQKLHADLLSDLGEEQSARLKYFNSLKALIESDLISKPERSDDLLKQLRANFTDIETALSKSDRLMAPHVALPLFDLFDKLPFGALIASFEFAWLALLSIDEVLIQKGSGDYIVALKTSLVCDVARYKDAEQKHHYGLPGPEHIVSHVLVATVMSIRVHYDPRNKVITAFSLIGAALDTSVEGFLRVRTPTEERPEYGIAVAEPVNLSNIEFITPNYETFRLCLRELSVEESSIPSAEKLATLGICFAPCITDAVLSKWGFIDEFSRRP